MAFKLIFLIFAPLMKISMSLDLLVFEEFGSAPLTDLVKEGSSVEDYEIYLDMSRRIHVGDLSICFSIFPDNKRSKDSGSFLIQVQVFQNESDITGTKDYIRFFDRVIPSFDGPMTLGDPYRMKSLWWNNECPAFKKYEHSPVFMKWLDNGELRAHHWINMCHIMDSTNNMYTLLVNGEQLSTEEMRFPAGTNSGWPKMEITRIIIGSKFTSTNYVPIGKFTALNIFSRTLSLKDAIDISSEYLGKASKHPDGGFLIFRGRARGTDSREGL